MSISVHKKYPDVSIQSLSASNIDVITMRPVSVGFEGVAGDLWYSAWGDIKSFENIESHAFAGFRLQAA